MHQDAAFDDPQSACEMDIRPGVAALLPDLQRYAIYLCRDRVAAEDLVQDVALRAIVKASLLKPGTNLRGWLMTMMRNLYLTAKRSTVARRTYALDDFSDALGTPESQEARLEFIEVAKAIKELSPPHREMLSGLCEGHAYADLAILLCIPIGTVRSRAHRARAALQHELEVNNSGRRAMRIPPPAIDRRDVPLNGGMASL